MAWTASIYFWHQVCFKIENKTKSCCFRFLDACMLLSYERTCSALGNASCPDDFIHLLSRSLCPNASSSVWTHSKAFLCEHDLQGKRGSEHRKHLTMSLSQAFTSFLQKSSPVLCVYMYVCVWYANMHTCAGPQVNIGYLPLSLSALLQDKVFHSTYSPLFLPG